MKAHKYLSNFIWRNWFSRSSQLRIEHAPNPLRKTLLSSLDPLQHQTSTNSMSHGSHTHHPLQTDLFKEAVSWPLPKGFLHLTLRVCASFPTTPPAFCCALFFFHRVLVLLSGSPVPLRATSWIINGVSECDPCRDTHTISQVSVAATVLIWNTRSPSGVERLREKNIDIKNLRASWMFHMLTGSKGLAFRPESTQVYLLLNLTSFMKDLWKARLEGLFLSHEQGKGLLKRMMKMGKRRLAPKYELNMYAGLSASFQLTSAIRLRWWGVSAEQRSSLGNETSMK